MKLSLNRWRRRKQEQKEQEQNINKNKNKNMKSKNKKKQKRKSSPLKLVLRHPWVVLATFLASAYEGSWPVPSLGDSFSHLRALCLWLG